MRIIKHFLALLIAIGFAGVSNADISYNELVSGDLASDVATPTDLGLVDLGKNTISGTLLNSVNFDPDVFSFTVAAGQQLDMVSLTSLSSTGERHFLAFHNGPLNQSLASENWITTLVDSSDLDDNFLTIGSLENTYGGTGLPGGPVGAGTYHIWLQETDGQDYDYTFSVSTSQAIPEPSSAVVALLGICAFAMRRRKVS